MALTADEVPAQPGWAVGQEGQNRILPMTQEIFDEYCKSSWHADPSRGAGLDRSRKPVDAYSIRCIDPAGKPEEIDDWEKLHHQVSDACNQHYHRLFGEESETRSYTDRLTTMRATYSGWACATYSSYAGVPNFEDWCQSTRYKYARNPEWVDREYPAFRWVCSRRSAVAPSGAARIPVDEVCQAQYGDRGKVLSRMYNAYGERVEEAWDCFYPE
ncbi:hypothetical protein [Streptomyces sp. bgisy034]|uniref:hypothetical protein n=1 Tax=Streptomyces sp. bgisy034 TaxID=3413774 RepID=UPI003EC03407